MEEQLPYMAEYAKTGRSSCKGCKTPIDKDTLRLAVMVQSPHFDGRVPNWYHMKCFFQKQRPKALGDFEKVLNLRIEDQNKLKEFVDQVSSGVVLATAKGAKGKKRPAKGEENLALKDFVLDYSKSNRSTCRGCELKIMKNEIRISKKDFETDVGKRYGGQDMWHHLECFAKLRSSLLFFASGDCLPGFPMLNAEDKKLVREKLPAISESDLPPEAKKIKGEPKDEVDKAEEAKEDKKYTKQMKMYYKYRDALKAFPKSDVHNLLKSNNQQPLEGVSENLDLLADVVTFGALLPCTVCKTGQFSFQNNVYNCTGNITEWSKCTHTESKPKRKAFKVPSAYADSPIFKNYKATTSDRIVKQLIKTVTVKKEEPSETDGPKIKREKPPLYNMEFFIHKTKAASNSIEKKIIRLGGRIGKKLHQNTMAVISTPEALEKSESTSEKARKYDVQVVPESFLEDIAKGGNYSDVIKATSLCEWGSEPATRLIPETKSISKSGKSAYKKSVSGPVKLKVKGGGAVDPDSGLEDVAHVYQKGDDKYNVVLGRTDIQTNKNSYYKLQILQADKGQKFWLFRSWGRIGTTIGGTKLEDTDGLNHAISMFKELYLDKTGNHWDERANFVKRPGLSYPIDLDYGEESDQVKGLTKDDISSNSKLAKPIQDLVQMIFDIEAMKKTMLEFELDLEKMPLGKLSKKQIEAAFGVLNELKEVITKSNAKPQIIDLCNRFYTMIPHDFGIDNPPLIETEEAIKTKLEMLDNLLELEVAYGLMQSTHVEGSESPLDAHYAQLKTDIEILDKTTDEFEIIKKYVKNTHAKTHQQYDLEIEEVFKIKRQNEDKRYKPFKKLPNRKLLWHGSRLTNYAGILSQGLRIAPPEAPVTGYMFGKGMNDMNPIT
ncbi:poly [ADP-ribose] polymerase isoform X2 [Chrysoperla carnea]|uniref:poly [ADP-ribose] polymerase isoform X2 n=1 Tax=Chrysoperla carnea TaxID=189513 RepID=UPI001D099877|nr:poly [ADP-ribose] polymerase isoform X2 [Chrysoperla carnea]